jgi:hypothetical protein
MLIYLYLFVILSIFNDPTLSQLLLIIWYIKNFLFFLFSYYFIRHIFIYILLLFIMIMLRFRVLIFRVMAISILYMSPMLAFSTINMLIRYFLHFGISFLFEITLMIAGIFLSSWIIILCANPKSWWILFYCPIIISFNIMLISIIFIWFYHCCMVPIPKINTYINISIIIIDIYMVLCICICMVRLCGCRLVMWWWISYCLLWLYYNVHIIDILLVFCYPLLC